MDLLRPGDPDQVGDYRLEGRLGAGGMGEVFYGRSPGGRPVAVKLIRRDHADVQEFRDRFAREVEAAKRIGGFHTAQVVAANPYADPPWMVTAYIAGPSLREKVEDHGPLTIEEIRTLGAGLAEGLAAIHDNGLVHRDLKPSNVLIAEDGPRIIDFGIAYAPDASTMTPTGAVLGTYAYMSPEQVNAQRLGPASDVFSLGCVLAFAATGRSPFAADAVPAIINQIINHDPSLDEIPGDLRDLIMACLTKDPADRPHVNDLLQRLTAPPPTPSPELSSAAMSTQPPTIPDQAPTSGLSHHASNAGNGEEGERSNRDDSVVSPPPPPPPSASADHGTSPSEARGSTHPGGSGQHPRPTTPPPSQVDEKTYRGPEWDIPDEARHRASDDPQSAGTKEPGRSPPALKDRERPRGGLGRRSHRPRRAGRTSVLAVLGDHPLIVMCLLIFSVIPLTVGFSAYFVDRSWEPDYRSGDEPRIKSHQKASSCGGPYYCLPTTEIDAYEWSLGNTGSSARTTFNTLKDASPQYLRGTLAHAAGTCTGGRVAWSIHSNGSLILSGELDSQHRERRLNQHVAENAPITISVKRLDSQQCGTVFRWRDPKVTEPAPNKR